MLRAPIAFNCSSKGPWSAPVRCAVAGAARGVPQRVAAVVAQRTTLGSGLEIAPIINGCWQLAGGHGREVYDGIENKLAEYAAAGLTTFDTADIYGPSEGILGEFQASWVAQGKPPVQILTKYVPDIFRQRVTPSGVESAVKRSLTKLKVQQLDLVQMHWWDYSVPGMVDAALALADCQAKGLVQAVGVTNMDVAAVAAMVDAGVPIVSNQVQFSLLDRRPLNGMVQYCSERGIKVLTYGSVGGGLLSDKYVETPRKGLLGGVKFGNVDLNTSSLKMYFGVVRRFGGQELWRRLLLVLRSIADKHNVSVANVAVRWCMQQGGGNTVYPIIGLTRKDAASTIGDNARILGLTLDASDLAAIDEVLSEATGPGGDIYSFERGE